MEKSKIHEDVLEDFLFDRVSWWVTQPELEVEHGKKKNELTLEEQVEFETELEEKKIKKQIKTLELENKKRGYEARTDFNLVDKGDFPELSGANSKHHSKPEEQFKEVVQSSQQKPATYQKKINEMFPTLDSDQDAHSSPKEKDKKENDKKEKAWWEKLNEKPIDEDLEVVNVKKKGKKKKV